MFCVEIIRGMSGYLLIVDALRGLQIMAQEPPNNTPYSYIGNYLLKNKSIQN
jgi:hypothetical protein